MKIPKAFAQHHSLTNLKKFQKSPVLYMEEAARLGSPVDLNIPIGDFILVTDPEQAQHVLATNHDNYTKSKGYKQIALVLGEGLFTAEGEHWYKQRKLLQPSFHKPELSKLLPSIWSTGMDYVSKLSTGNDVHLDSEMSGLTLSVLLNSLIRYQDSQISSIISDNLEFGQEFIMGRIRSPLKWPLWLPTAANRRYHHMMEMFDQMVQKCIDTRKSIGDQEINDIISILMSNHDSQAEFDQIRDELLTFLVAGHETSALAMTWTIHLLGHYPDIQEKLFQEVKNIEKLEDMDMQGFSNLSYTVSVIKESLRLYPPGWNIVRQAKDKDIIGGIPIEKDKQVMINIHLLHRNKAYWDDPEEFRPDRFRQNTLKHKFQYLPFAAGPRFCIGNNFAMFEMVILLVQLVKHIEFKPISPRDVPFNPLLTLRPKNRVETHMLRRD